MDEDQLKSIISTKSPVPASSRPPTKRCARYEKTDKKGDNEYYDDKKDNDEKESEGIEKGCRRILVTGLPAEISRDTLELYFENKKKTGGGEIVSATINEKKMQAIIEFKDIEGTSLILYLFINFVRV